MLSSDCRRVMAVLSLWFLFSVLFSNVVKADYPPPSEDGHPYYSRTAIGTSRMHLPDWDGPDWSPSVGAHGSARCVDIPSNLSLCRNMEYSQMRLPNLLEHDTLKEVSQQASSWVRLLDVRCHADTQVFLCSLFAPVCLDRPVWPCRSLCEAVKSGCEDRMLRYGFPWPEMLRCDQYPQNDDLCIPLRATDPRASGNTQCPPCAQSETYDNIIDNFCSSDVAMRVKVEQTIVSSGDLKVVVAKKRKLYKTSATLKAKEARELALFIDGGARCDCAKLEQTGGTRQSTNYLIMAHKVTDRLVIDSVLSLDQRSKDITRAMRTIRDRNVCRRPARPSTPAMPSAEGRPKKERTRRPATTPQPTTVAMASTTARNRRTQTTGNRRQQMTGTQARRP